MLYFEHFCEYLGKLLRWHVRSVSVYMRVMADEIVHLRIPDKVYTKLKKIAEAEKRPVANLLRYVLIKFVEDANNGK